MRCLALLCALLLGGAGCARCTVQPDGTITGMAVGNAACSVCKPDEPLGPGLKDAPPLQPITPATKPGCTIVQGGAEAGSTWASMLGVLGGLMAGLLLK